MIGDAMFTTIKTLYERGLNKSEIARATSHDWKTVSKTIEDIKAGKEYPEKKPHPKKIDPYKEQVIELIEKGLTAIRIHEELVKLGCDAAYPTVKRCVANIKKTEDIFIRIHTEAGKEAQVDFGYVGLTPDNNGKRRKTWVFHMMLCHSRYSYYEKVYDQRVETFIQCHINAFEYFGGIPECVKIDNLKAAVLQASFYEPVYQELYKNFADYYRFQIIPCRIYSPNDKGKVESGIKYVKNNFFAGRSFKDADDLNRRLKNWMNNKCNVRIHGTTKKIPYEVFTSEEKPKLNSLPITPFKMSKVGTRKVYHDCHIYVDHNYYSVPFKYVGLKVEIELNDKVLRISCNHKEIAVHTRLKGKGEFATNDAHYPRYKKISETEYQEKYQIKMKDIGEYAQQFFFFVLEKKPGYWKSTIQGVLSLTKTYSPEIINLSCKRALAFQAWQYNTIKNICKNGAYNLPIEQYEEEVCYEYSKN
jgi:transposase